MHCVRWSVSAAGILCLLSIAPALAVPPQPVSPSGLASGGCPTFSWSETADAAGYELVVYAVSEAGEAEAAPVLSAALPAGATAWTPSADRCLAPGGSYAWSLRSTVDGVSQGWSQPALFRVAAGPSIDEVEAAIATLRRYIAEGKGDAVPPSGNVSRGPSREGTGRSGAQRRAERGTTLAPTEERGAAVTKAREEMAARMRKLEVLGAQIGGDLKSVAAASAPTLGSPSLGVSSNIALGANSNVFKDGLVLLWDDTTGNTGLGRGALSSATGTATYNTAVGSYALQFTSQGGYDYEGSHNTGIGRAALRSNTTGRSNTAVGENAMYGNDTGIDNSAVGVAAMFSNTTGSHNTASGSFSLFHNDTGVNNTATGHAALFSNTTGSNNTATGVTALDANTTGYINTATGKDALRSNTEGHRNTASGAYTLSSTTTGNHNTANGVAALTSNSTGSFNTAGGASALWSNTTGYNNVASGFHTLYHSTTGSGNVAVGSGAGFNLGYNVATPTTSMSDNVFIANPGETDEQQTIRIGTNGTHARSFFAGIRDATTANPDAIAVMIDSAGQLGTVSSSRTVKQDIRAVRELGDRLLALRPVAFRYKTHAQSDPETPFQFGLIAEEVAEVFPELVVYDEEGRPATVKYHLLAPLLLAELQWAEKATRATRTELRALQDRVRELESRGPRTGRVLPRWRRPGGGQREP